ncbi:MAG: hypothetical protein P8X91_03315 [Candidatus Bathyarchaeota archaeon]
MKKKILVTIVCLFVLIISAFPMSSVLAVKPTEISGNFTVDIFAITMTPIKGPFGNVPITIQELTGIDCFTFTGDISGTASYSARWMYHGDFSNPENFLTFTGITTFEDVTITVGDTTATGELVIKSTGNEQHQAGLWTVISSNLENTEGEQVSLHGQGEFLEPAVLGSYDVIGQLHFNP